MLSRKEGAAARRVGMHGAEESEVGDGRAHRHSTGVAYARAPEKRSSRYRWCVPYHSATFVARIATTMTTSAVNNAMATGSPVYIAWSTGPSCRQLRARVR